MPSPIMTVNSHLTAYAAGIMPDVQPLIAEADLFAPRVPVGTNTGTFNLFNANNAFTEYDASRAYGGAAQRIKFGTDVGQFNCTPFALEIGIDEHELTDDEASNSLIREAKTRTVVTNSALSHYIRVMAAVNGAVAAVGGVGNWSNANVDPIAEIDAQILAIWSATGMTPNRVIMDLGAWNLARGNPLTRARWAGIDAAVSGDQFRGALLNPEASLHISKAQSSGRFAAAAKAKTPVLGTRCYIMYTSSAPSQYDPSAAKTFVRSLDMLQSVRTYQEPRVEVVAVDWSADVRIIGNALIRRIDVT